MYKQSRIAFLTLIALTLSAEHRTASALFEVQAMEAAGAAVWSWLIVRIIQAIWWDEALPSNLVKVMTRLRDIVPDSLYLHALRLSLLVQCSNCGTITAGCTNSSGNYQFFVSMPSRHQDWLAAPSPNDFSIACLHSTLLGFTA